MLTQNEKKVLRLLMVSVNKDYSINQIAKICGLAPNGALKILRKFRKEGILKLKDIANAKSYRLDFDNSKTTIILNLALSPELTKKLDYRFEDLKEIKGCSQGCVVFGSYIEKKNPNDIDILFILKKSGYKDSMKKLDEIRSIIPLKVHEIIQTSKDLELNILNEDKVIINALQNGVIFWGSELIIDVIGNVYKG